MSQCLEQCAACGRTTGPEEPKQKNAATRIAREARRVCDVFVVGGATAVGYLWGCLSEICANPGGKGEGHSRAGSLPQLIFGVQQYEVHSGPPVGASLLAMTVGQSISMLNVRSQSRASSLPQLIFGVTNMEFTPEPMWERACSRWVQARRYKAFSRAVRSWQ